MVTSTCLQPAWIMEAKYAQTGLILGWESKKQLQVQKAEDGKLWPQMQSKY